MSLTLTFFSTKDANYMEITQTVKMA